MCTLIITCVFLFVNTFCVLFFIILTLNVFLRLNVDTLRVMIFMEVAEMSKFSNNLKSLRVRFGLTQQDLANKLGVSKSTVSMYETGNRAPDFEMLEAIADLFNVSLDSLIGAQGKSENEIKVLAAHAIDDLTEDEQLEIIKYAKYIKSQRDEANKK